MPAGVGLPGDGGRARDRWRGKLLAFQAGYYVLAGLWPLLYLSGFEAVTGPKTDDWLVQMVALLAVVIGSALGVAAYHDRGRAPEVVVLAAGAALAFAGIDAWYGLAGRIAPIYLADAVLEMALLVGLAWTRRGADH